MRRSGTIFNCPPVVAFFSFNPFYLELILSQMICYTSPLPTPPRPAQPRLPHLELSSCLPMPHHYTTARVGFRGPPADKAWKNARLFGLRVCLTVIGYQTAGWPVWACAPFPELNVHFQLCLRQNSGIPFSPQPAP